MVEEKTITEKPVAEKKTAKPERVDVSLKKTHTHAGTAYQVGDVINVTANEAEFLKKHQVI